jgi:hypothetical protein
MWTWFSCYLSGRHEFGVSCEPGAIFLRCVNCGRRSTGWSLNAVVPGAPAISSSPAKAPAKPAPQAVPFDRAPAR